MSDSLYFWGVALMAAFSLINFAYLPFSTAPYGRHAGKTGGRVNAKLGWMLMEAPSPIMCAVLFVQGSNATALPALILFALFQAHYIYRSFIYPFRIRGGAEQTYVIVASSIVFNVINGSLIGWGIGQVGGHLAAAGWLADPRFWIGAALFGWGYFVNHQSDSILRNLRKPGETGYKIPRGGMFRWITSPNYFGEIVEWIGFAIASWTTAGAVFALATASNLGPRALSHHKWYQEKFPDYPKERKAIVPGVL